MSGPAGRLPGMTNAHDVVAAYWAAAEVRDWDAFGALLADEIRKWAAVVKESGASAD